MALIYIVEDDNNISEIECFALKNAGYETRHFTHAGEFYQQVLKTVPDLVLMDVMLPDSNGLTVVKRLREQKATRKLPILLVSGMTTELDIVKGLDSGADDYLVKPFGVMELVSRVKALLRRMQPEDREQVTMEHISMDKEKRKVFVDGCTCDLTYKEFELLYLLLKNKGNVLTRDYLMEQIWGVDFMGESRTLDMHIRTLRKKLGEAGKEIKTVHNVGYRYDT